MRFCGRSYWLLGALVATIGLIGAGRLASAGAAESTAGLPLVEIRAETKGDGNDTSTALVCQLNSCLEATITIDATLTNLEPSHPLPYTFVARNQQPEVVLKFTPISRSRPNHFSFSFTSRYGGTDGQHDRRAVYRLPYPRVKAYTVSQGNLGRVSHGQGSGNEYAVDWTMPDGSMVLAARGGIVVGLKQDSNQGGDDRQFDMATNLLVIKHDDGTYAEYLHLRENSALVKLGQKVNAGTPIASSGNTGRTTGPHLHVAVFVNRNGVDRTCLPVRWVTKHGVVERLLEGTTY
jgi:murein DD-endopeptidase MepM/ murein hydrolase activator NlpD